MLGTGSKWERPRSGQFLRHMPFRYVKLRLRGIHFLLTSCLNHSPCLSILESQGGRLVRNTASHHGSQNHMGVRRQSHPCRATASQARAKPRIRIKGLTARQLHLRLLRCPQILCYLGKCVLGDSKGTVSEGSWEENWREGGSEPQSLGAILTGWARMMGREKGMLTPVGGTSSQGPVDFVLCREQASF